MKTNIRTTTPNDLDFLETLENRCFPRYQQSTRRAIRYSMSSPFQKVFISETPALIAEGIISGGMIPKVDCCMDAIRGGVNSVHIVNGCMDHSMLLELFTDEGIGTMVVKE